jgi:hypothetical protein
MTSRSGKSHLAILTTPQFQGEAPTWHDLGDEAYGRTELIRELLIY